MRIHFDIKDISVYRSELMGWSILWVMMLHFTFNQITPLGFVAQYGFAGVDIFMMVSGLGLYYSLNKTPNFFCFIRKDYSVFSQLIIFSAYLLVLFYFMTIFSNFFFVIQP